MDSNVPTPVSLRYAAHNAQEQVNHPHPWRLGALGQLQVIVSGLDPANFYGRRLKPARTAAICCTDGNCTAAMTIRFWTMRANPWTEEMPPLCSQTGTSLDHFIYSYKHHWKRSRPQQLLPKTLISNHPNESYSVIAISIGHHRSNAKLNEIKDFVRRCTSVLRDSPALSGPSRIHSPAVVWLTNTAVKQYLVPSKYSNASYKDPRSNLQASLRGQASAAYCAGEAKSCYVLDLFTPSMRWSFEEGHREELFLPMTDQGATVLVHTDGDQWIASKPDLQTTSSTKGLSYRWSKRLDDTHFKVAKWGFLVRGVDTGDGWLQVIKFQSRYEGKDPVHALFDVPFF